MGERKLDLKIEELEERVAPLLLPAIQVDAGVISGEVNLVEGDGSVRVSFFDARSKNVIFNEADTGAPLAVEVAFEIDGKA